jgi:hypothetical protein
MTSSTRQFTRAQRRQLQKLQKLQKLADRVDRVLQADRLYFERRPDRQHRVRLSSRSEIEQQEIIDGNPMAAPPGCRFYTAVKNFAQNCRLCLFTINLENSETDLCEGMARSIFEFLVEPYQEIEAEMRKAAEAGATCDHPGQVLYLLRKRRGSHSEGTE